MDISNRADIRKFIKILWIIFVTLLLTLLVGALVLQIPQVQTAIAEKVIDALSENIEGEISFEKIHFKPFNTLVVKNLVITDKHPATDPADSTRPPIDTLFHAEYVIAKFSLSGLLDKESPKIEQVHVNNARMNLVLEDYVNADGALEMGNNISRMFGLYDRPKKDMKNKELFNIKDAVVSNMRFTLTHYGTNKIRYIGGIDWNNLDINDINVQAQGLRFKNGIMYGIAQKVSFRESTGFDCRKLSGKVRVGRGKTIIKDLRLEDEWSKIHVPAFMMSYSGIEAFKDFIRQVKLDGVLAESTVDFRTLTYFAPQLEGVRLRINASGVMSGYVDDFVVRDAEFASLAGGFSGKANGRITGLPEVMDTRLEAEVSDIRLTMDGLGKFVSEWMKGDRLDLSGFGKGLEFTGTASASGLIDTMRAKANLTSSAGSLNASTDFRNLLRFTEPILMNGTVSSKDIDLGKILEDDTFGPTTVSSNFSMNIDEEFSVNIESMKIDRLNLLKYDYRNIFANGFYDSRSVNAKVVSQDPNLNFIFQGGYAKSDKSQNTVYKFIASVGYADLNAVNIDKRGKSIVQFTTNADFTHTGRGDIMGNIDIADIVLENKAGRHDIGDIILSSYSNDNKYDAKFKSSFANASFIGTGSVLDFIRDIRGLTIKSELPALMSDSEYSWKGDKYDFALNCHDMQNILGFFLPGMYIEDGTYAKISVSRSGELLAQLNSKRIAFKRNYMKNLSLSFDNLQESISGSILCDEISVANLIIKDNILQLHADDNIFGAGFSFNNHTDPESKGELIVNGKLSRDEESTIFDLKIRPSSLQYGSREWSIQPSNVRIHNGTIEVDSFGAISGGQTVSLHGRASEEVGDVLTLNLERFDLSVINSLLIYDWRFKGAVTGTAVLTSPLSETNLTADVICDSAYIADIPLGIVKAQTQWDDIRKRFEIGLSNDLDGVQNLVASGTYAPKDNMLDAKASLTKADVGYGFPFFSAVFNDMSGYVSGELYAKGPIDRLSLSSRNARLDSTMLKLSYTGVPYYANGPFHIDETGIHFDGIEISDRYDGKGKVTGSINYQYFKDLSFDTHINVDRIEALDLSEKEGEMYYGNVFASGDLSITGPLRSITMNIDAKTEKTGELRIPTDFTLSSSTGTNLLKFKTLDTLEFIDPYDIFVQKTVKAEETAMDFLLKMNVNATPGVEAFVEIDKANGNILSGRGNGNIKLEVGTDVFNINGDYTLTDGNYKFVAMGLVSRDFKIQDGSSVRFAGDIWDSVLDIDATYTTKTSIATLISDTTSVSNRRTVECGIDIQDKLSNPKLTFSIEIPDLDPTIKSRVESALSTQDKVQKQFLSLIISNNFLPDEQSGIVNNSSVLYSNVSEMMSNQINNIFQKLNIPLDLGLKYQPNERGNDIFDVAVSTQLFNNRVVVNGNIGNKQYSSGNTQNEVVGDIDIEIKLDRSGSFRLNLFSHSADQYTNYLDNSQRSGVGITYQTEFNSFKEFFKNLFTSRKKKKSMVIEQSEVKPERVSINIERPESKRK